MPASRRTPSAAATLVAAALTLLVMRGELAAFENDKPPQPDHSHKCPVCGMFVYRYPDFIASVSYDDGHTVFFDGVKDMFKYLFNLSLYAPDRSRERIDFIRVTEYYDLKALDGRTAVYVIGSDVLGPMGHELIPFQSKADAQLFSKDHHGRRVLPFEQITPAVIQQLD